MNEWLQSTWHEKLLQGSRLRMHRVNTVDPMSKCSQTDGKIAASAARNAATSLIFHVRSILTVMGCLRTWQQTNLCTVVGANVHLKSAHCGMM